MGKVFAILVIVLGIWIGLELMTKGSDEAFGGLLVKAGVAEKSETPATPPLKRSAGNYDRAYREGASRVDRQLDQID